MEQLLTFISTYNLNAEEGHKHHVYCSVLSHNKPQATVRDIANHNEYLIVDRAYQDFDDRHMEEAGYHDHWFDHMYRLHAFLAAKNIRHYMQASSYSGGHPIIFCKEQTLHSPNDAVYNFITFLESKCHIHCDPAIKGGGLNRVYRIPSTYHITKQCWCTPLTVEELETRDLDVIQVVSKQRELIVDKYITGERLVDLSRFDRSIPNRGTQISVDLKQLLTKEHSGTVGQVDVSQFPPCVRTWCRNPELGYWGRYELIQYLRHQQLVKLTPQDILQLMQSFLSEKKYQHMVGTRPEDEGNRPMQFIYSHDYKPSSCFQLQRKNLCPELCGRWHPVYT
jgi:hypothetical protein